MYQQQKRYNTAMDRFGDIKLVKGLSWLERSQVAMHSQLPRFLVLLLVLLLVCISIARNADRCNSQSDSVRQVRLSVRHIPVFRPEE